MKPYNPAESEAGMYDLWEKSGYFNPDNLPGERSGRYHHHAPPNANGSCMRDTRSL